METIFALSSGRPPAAVAVMRISGPAAFDAVRALAGDLPEPRRASLRSLRERDGALLDRALVLVFPGPRSATGEDLAELHLHGGRAVVDAVVRVLEVLPDLRGARPGEFTRRALENGRVDLAQAQGLADLLEADTEGARRAALAASEGAVGRAVTGWLGRVSQIAALVEAALDHSDEDDVEADVLARAEDDAARLTRDLDEVLARPSVERLRDGALVVIAGPPNAGKSSLFNMLVDREAAIVTPIAGTTRDVLEATVVRDGLPFRLVDTAGLARDTADAVEAIGVERADRIIAAADTILWLGNPAEAPPSSILVFARADVRDGREKGSTAIPTSTSHPASVESIWAALVARHSDRATWNDAYFHDDQRRMVMQVGEELRGFRTASDPLIAAEHLRQAHRMLATMLGVDATEAMLDALFSRFCIGK